MIICRRGSNGERGDGQDFEIHPECQLGREGMPARFSQRGIPVVSVLWSSLKKGQCVRWAPNQAGNVERHAGEEERVPADLVTVVGQGLEVPELADVQAKV